MSIWSVVILLQYLASLLIRVDELQEENSARVTKQPEALLEVFDRIKELNCFLYRLESQWCMQKDAFVKADGQLESPLFCSSGGNNPFRYLTIPTMKSSYPHYWLNELFQYSGHENRIIRTKLPDGVLRCTKLLMRPTDLLREVLRKSIFDYTSGKHSFCSSLNLQLAFTPSSV